MALSSRLPRASSYRFNEIFISLLLCLMLLVSSDATQQCERLKATLTYTQEEAPRDLSVVVRVCV